MYHTHPPSPSPGVNESYSTADKQVSDYEGVPSYMASSSGAIYKYTPVPDRPLQGNVSIIGITEPGPSNPMTPLSPWLVGPQLRSPDSEVELSRTGSTMSAEVAK